MTGQKAKKPKTKEQEALDQIKAVYDDNCAEINGRKYKFTITTHITRRKIFAFFSKVQHDIKRGDFSFLASSEFAKIEKEINNIITFDGNLLGKIDDHWEEYPEDYLNFISVALGVISYPFLKGNLTA